jgi:hypothetical protein
MDLKKKILLVGLILVCCFIAGTLILWNTLQNEAEKQRQIKEKVLSVNDVDALKMCEDTKEITRFVCFTALASKTKDAKLCERIDSETNRYLCIKEAAGATKDSAICDQIKPIRISGVEVKIDYLTHWCVAMAKRDMEECKKIEDSESVFRSRCIEEVKELMEAS